MTIVAEIICNTAHACHEVLTWSRLCAVRVCEFHLESCCIIAESCLCPLGQPGEERIHHVYCYGCCVSQERLKILLWLLCKPGDRSCCVRFFYGSCYCCYVSQERKNKTVFGSYSSWHFLPASELKPCLPWVQQTVQTI